MVQERSQKRRRCASQHIQPRTLTPGLTVGFDGKLLGVEDPVPAGGPDVWGAHPRLLRHLEDFKHCSNRSAVLAKYAAAAANVHVLNRGLLHRYACHAGAWTALLPQEEAGGTGGPNDLSPARVLARLLQRRGKGPLSPWLHGVLRLVQKRLQEVPPDSAHWDELRRSMPRWSWSGSGGRGASKGELCDVRRNYEGEGAEITRAASLGAVRERQRHALVAAGALCDASRDVAIAEALRRGRAALSADDADATVQAVVDCTSFLAAPRNRATFESRELMSEEAKHALRDGAQRELRHLLILLLRGLDLEDCGTLKLLVVPFGRLRCLVDGAHWESVACKTQWATLVGLCVGAQTPGSREPSEVSAGQHEEDSVSTGPEKAAAQPAIRDGRGKTRNRTRSSMWKPRGSKNIMEKGLLKRLMIEAMARLPRQQGTYEDIVRKMNEDEDLKALASGKLDTRPHVEKGKTRPYPVWQNRVAVRMRSYFQKTEFVVGRRALWTLVPESRI